MILRTMQAQLVFGVRRAHDNGDKAELAVAAIVGDIQDSA
jgi:hypothetical protein